MPPSRNRHSAQRVFTWDKIKMALAAAEEGFYIWNIKTGVIHYTDRCLTMMGASRKEKAPNIFTQPELTIHEEDQAFFFPRKCAVIWTATPMCPCALKSG